MSGANVHHFSPEPRRGRASRGVGDGNAGGQQANSEAEAAGGVAGARGRHGQYYRGHGQRRGGHHQQQHQQQQHQQQHQHQHQHQHQYGHNRRSSYRPGSSGNPHGQCLCGESLYRVDELPGGHVNGHSLRLEQVKEGLTLLGNHEQFCHAFWHMAETPELKAAQTPMCLRADSSPSAEHCAGKGVVLVVRLRAQDAETGVLSDVFVARYTNCPDNDHAEMFMLRDGHLRKSLSEACGGQLVMYINKQPCHFSSDFMRAQQSCTEDLLAFAENDLRPLNIGIEVVICYTYRAHWELDNLNQRQRQRYGPAIEAARDGLSRFSACRDRGVLLRAMQSSDWLWLVGLCDSDVQQDYRSASEMASSKRPKHYNANLPSSQPLNCKAVVARRSLFSEPQFKAREAMDLFVQSVVEKWSQ